MSDDDASEGLVVDEGEVRVAAVVEVAHVHTAVEHDSFSVDGYDHAALAYLLPGA